MYLFIYFYFTNFNLSYDCLFEMLIVIIDEKMGYMIFFWKKIEIYFEYDKIFVKYSLSLNDKNMSILLSIFSLIKTIHPLSTFVKWEGKGGR